MYGVRSIASFFNPGFWPLILSLARLYHGPVVAPCKLRLMLDFASGILVLSLESERSPASRLQTTTAPYGQITVRP